MIRNLPRNLLALLLCSLAAACTPEADPTDAPVPAANLGRAESDQPNIILITLESLRPDHVGAYGGKSRSQPEVPVTTVIDAFSAEAMVYEDAHSVTSWTLASHASLFSGLYPTAHQTRRATDRLDDSYLTMAERLAVSGYDTAGVISGPYLRKTHNLNQGFSHYHDEISSESNAESHTDTTNPRMLATMRSVIEGELDPSRPFFLFSYFWDPHYDYVPPEPYASMFQGPDCEPIDVRHYESTSTVNDSITSGQLAYVFSQYAGEIRWTDETLGQFFQFLKDRGLWDNTVIILTADHGEEFFDHGEKGHYNNVYTESVHVPLIVKYAKGGPVGRDSRLVSLVDVLPTVLELSGANAEEPLDGRSILDPAPAADRSIFYELLSIWTVADSKVSEGEKGTWREWPSISGWVSLWNHMFSNESPLKLRVQTWSGVRQGKYKLVVSPELERLELYDVVADPKETGNLAADHLEIVSDLEKNLAAWQANEEQTASQFTQGDSAELSDDEIAELRSLGYLQ